MSPRRLVLLGGLIGALSLSAALAEQKEVYEGYEVHYAAMLTSDLSPEVARAYGIPRSGKRALVMIHARETDGTGDSRSVGISIDGKVSNLVGQVRKLGWQQIEEDSAIYSLSHFPVTHRERLSFTLDITPDDSTRRLPLKFQQEFYTE